MRPGLTFAAAMTLLAGAAAAQTAGPPSATNSSPAVAAAQPAPADAKPKTGGDTLSGVTVMPIPKKACAPRDKDCIGMVVAELKRLYPEQLKQFCVAEQMKMVRTQFTNDQLIGALNSNDPPPPTSTATSSIIKTACAPDKK